MAPAISGTSFPLEWRLLSVHQDFAWFAVVVLWSWAVVVWWRHPDRRTDWGWLPVTALAVVVAAGVQFLIYDPTFDWFQDRLVPGTTNIYVPALIEVELLGDFLITAIWVLLAAWWWWSAAAGSRLQARDWLGWGVSAGVGCWQITDPLWGTWALALWALVAAGRWDKRRGQGSWRLMVVATLPVLSTVGPVAAWLGCLQREAPATPWGVAAALWQVGAGLWVLGRLGRAALQTRAGEDSATNRRELWYFSAGALIWLLIGLGYAYRVGADNRRELHQNRLRSVAAEAMVFDPVRLDPLVGDNLRIEEAGVPAGGRDLIQLRAPVLSSAAAWELRHEMARILKETPFLDRARILTLHEDRLIELVSSPFHREAEEVEVIRAATADDHWHWQNPGPYVELNDVPEIDAEYYCRAPIISRDGRMLGWLDYVRREFFQSLERKWRAGPLLVVALGLVAGGLVVLQRRSLREREWAWRNAALETESNRMKTAFLAKVSHELRTPLQSLLGYGELLERDATDETQRHRLSRLREHGDLLLRMVNDLLDLSAMESGGLKIVPAPVELENLVEATVEGLRTRAEAKGLALRCTIDSDLVGEWHEADAARVRQIVFNLVGNAIKFTASGEVNVTLERADSPATATSDTVCIRVKDTGPGIDATSRANLFTAFSRLDKTRAEEGSGLGLAVVAALARLMDGTVAVESDGRTGSEFVVDLRLPRASPPAYTRRATDGPLRSLAGRRILIAEDNPLVQELFISVLQDLGASCVIEDDGERALQTALIGRFDAMVLDLALPGVDGREVARRLRAKGVGPAGLRIVGVSAHATTQDRKEALAAGMDVFLTKPVKLTELAAALVGEETPEEAEANKTRAAEPRIRSRLEVLFVEDLTVQTERLQAARAAGDLVRLRRVLHYLANSASVVEDRDLLEISRELEATVAISKPGDPAQWTRMDSALAVWLREGDGSEPPSTA